jgi:hypothetical protein
MTAVEQHLRRLDRAPLLALALFLAASAVLALQQWLYHSEYQHYLTRERICKECSRPAAE